jgi:two-component system NarL family sensor kinase
MQEVQSLIITGTVFIVLFSGFIVLLVRLFNKTRQSYLLEKQNMTQQFQQLLLQSQLEIQEQTFNTISQEIHDNVGQILSVAKMQVSIIEQKEVKDFQTLKELRENIGQALNDLRDIAKGLSTERIKLFSLHEIVAYEVQRINRTGVLSIHIDVEGNEQQLQEQKKLILFRIIQESIQNVIKHARASVVKVLFHYLETKLDISITDNGIGFNVLSTLQKNSGLGLQNIINRAKLIGGNADISSVVDEGTNIKLSIPYA